MTPLPVHGARTLRELRPSARGKEDSQAGMTWPWSSGYGLAVVSVGQNGVRTTTQALAPLTATHAIVAVSKDVFFFCALVGVALRPNWDEWQPDG